jgi:hypothetical protein
MMGLEIINPLLSPSLGPSLNGKDSAEGHLFF